MRYTLYSVNDWLDDEEALEVARREQYRALDDPHKAVDVEIESVHDRKRMNTDQVQNLALIIIVIFFMLAIVAVWRR
jgi:hypothetical protein